MKKDIQLVLFYLLVYGVALCFINNGKEGFLKAFIGGGPIIICLLLTFFVGLFLSRNGCGKLTIAVLYLFLLVVNYFYWLRDFHLLIAVANLAVQTIFFINGVKFLNGNAPETDRFETLETDD